jgi:hypothetical protein
MKPEPELRRVRIVDFQAEHWEREAAAMPPSFKEQADLHRAIAKALRESPDERTVLVRTRYVADPFPL